MHAHESMQGQLKLYLFIDGFLMIGKVVIFALSNQSYFQYKEDWLIFMALKWNPEEPFNINVKISY